MKLDTLADLLHQQIKDLYSAEIQIRAALPRMVKKAGSSALKRAFEQHLSETEAQIQRLEKVGHLLEITVRGHTSRGAEGLIAEAGEILDADGQLATLDAAMIAAAQRIKHFEIAGYGTCIALADLLGFEEVSEYLSTSLEEESACDEKLSEIAETEVNPASLELFDGEEDSVGVESESSLEPPIRGTRI